MLTKERNDFLCQTGPGTPMGTAMRRFWWPVLISDELSRDSDPVLVGLLGERFVAFRDSAGRVGILNERCCHRGATLLIGRVEDCGIRCMYHGWKFDVEGKLLHAPNVASEIYLDKVRQPSYPVREEGGLIWTYIGPPEHEPPFRRMPWADLPSSRVDIFGFLLPTNYLAELENHFDGGHITLHHDAALDYPIETQAAIEPTFATSLDTPPSRGEFEESDFGFYYAMIRDDAAGGPPAFTLVVPFVVPTTVVPISNDTGSVYVFDVPVDDVTTLNFWVQTNTAEELPRLPPIWERMPDLCEQMPNRLIATLKLNDQNRYLQDRNSMRNGRYAGFLGRPKLEDPVAGPVMWREAGGPASLFHQDLAIMLALGDYPTRSMEHTVPCDIGVLQLRRTLTHLAQQVAVGEAPPSVKADVAGVRCHSGRHVPDWRKLLLGQVGVTA